MLVLCNFTGEEVPLALPDWAANLAPFLGNYAGICMESARLTLRPYECVVLK